MNEIEKILVEMESDPWHVKIRCWWNLKTWQLTCWSRKFWDKSFSGYIFKR